MRFVIPVISFLGGVASILGLAFALAGGTLEDVQNQIHAWESDSKRAKVEAEIKLVEAENRRLELLVANSEAKRKQIVADTNRRIAEAEARRRLLEQQRKDQMAKKQYEEGESTRKTIRKGINRGLERAFDKIF
ncbi:MAG: hypothetical protein OET90_00585 [Desulfuromonadales bacterium]|nr:hypothetical protein [Desulfuromonadales bacterium]